MVAHAGPHEQATPAPCQADERTPLQQRQAEMTQAIQGQGYQHVTSLNPRANAEGALLFKAYDPNGTALVISGVELRSPAEAMLIVNETLRLSALRHAHLLALKSIWRRGRLIFIVQEHAGGGDVFSLAKRAGSPGLPERAAQFLFQQLVYTLLFGHEYSITLQEISPSRLLIAWNQRSVPVLKISALQALRSQSSRTGQGPPSRVATMYSSIHWLREDLAGLHGPARAHAAATCDLWSSAVTFYYLLFGRWPFSKTQISRWLVTPPAEWKDDEEVTYTREGAALPSDDVIAFLKAVFATGRQGLSEVQAAGSGMTLEAVAEAAWFRRELPEGVDRMNADSKAKTDALRAAPQQEAQRQRLLELAAHAA
eukprot:jgi/Ulvmu1/11940/UM082_0019.1